MVMILECIAIMMEMLEPLVIEFCLLEMCIKLRVPNKRKSWSWNIYSNDGEG